MEVLNFLINIVVNNLLSNCFIYFKEIVESENAF